MYIYVEVLQSVEDIESCVPGVTSASCTLNAAACTVCFSERDSSFNSEEQKNG